MKIAVVTDSNSGITQKQGEEMGISVVPMPFMIDGETYFEDITLTQEEFYHRLERNADISTSQPSPETVTKLWDRLLSDHDQVVHIPTQYQSVRDALMLIGQGADGAQIKKRLEETAKDSVIFITVDTLKYLKKGGRITPAAAALGTLLKIKPVLIILGEKLDAYAKARTVKQAKSVMLTAIQKELETRLHDGECRRCHLAIAHTNNEEAALEFKKEVAERYPYADVIMAPLSLSIACHIGPGSLAVTATRKMDEEYEEDHGAV